MKRYGVIFTCFYLRAVHIEVAATMDTTSFINALRRFIARRGQIRSLLSDNGTNFVGAENELFKEINQLDHIQEFLQLHNCDWIDWKRKPPISSHMGGVL